jgi:hypothetical protein
MHQCCICGRTDQGPGFLGFHAFTGSQEICDSCAQVYGCRCCEDLATSALHDWWRRVAPLLGIDPEEITPC